jgi:uncharacterized protein YqeY
LTLFERLESDLSEARRRSDQAALAALGLLKSEVVNASKEADFKGSVDDALVIATARKEIKRRQESADAFAGAGREEAAERERAAARVIEVYLPQQLSDEELERELRRIIDDLKPSGPGAFGMVMKDASQKLAGRAEGSRIAATARRLIG